MLIPVIKVRDKNTGYIHVVGTNSHDALLCNGKRIVYYNLQNGEGTEFSSSAYEFLAYCEDDDMDYSLPKIEFVTLDEWIKLSEQKIEEAAETKIAFYREFVDKWHKRLEEAKREARIFGDSGGEILE